MKINIHPHAQTRISERGATESEVIDTVQFGESSPTGLERTKFRRNFVYNDKWKGRYYATKQVEVIAVQEEEKWVVITVLVKFF